MDITPSVDILAFGFDTQESLRPELAQHLQQLRGRGILRILDVLFVSKDSHGRFRADRQQPAFETATATTTPSTLWQLLVDGDPESGIVAEGLLGKFRSWEVGLDLDWIEGLGQLIEPGTSALLMLVQAKWASDLLDVVLESGGFPLVFGCLERETMLVVGPDLAATSVATRNAERTAARRGVAMLEVLEAAQTMAPTATQLIAALLEARLIDECEVDAAVDVLAAQGLIPPPIVARAQAHADAAIADIRRVSVHPVETEG